MKKMIWRRLGGLALGILLGWPASLALPEVSGAAEEHLAGSCDVTAILGYCMEYKGAEWTRDKAQEDCGTAPDGVFGSSPCPAENRVGVCVYLPSKKKESRIDYVFYAPMEVSTAKLSCPGEFTPVK